MLEQRNKRLFALLLGLLVATVATIWWIMPENTSFVVDKNLFRKTDLKTVNGVILTTGTSTVKLTYDGTRWKVNEQYPADRNMIEVLFATLQGVEPRRPVAEAIKDSVAQALEKNGVRVELQAGGQVVETFYAGGNTGKSQAYFRQAGNNIPYIMVIPGYRVYASGIFELDENGWRDKYVFGFNWRNFKSLQAAFPDKRNDFKISLQDSYFGIEGLQQADTTKLNTFLDNVSLLTVSQYVQTDTLASRFSTQEPVMGLAVDDIAGRQYTLKLFEIPPGKQYAGQLKDNQWALFDAARIAPIRRPKGFFSGK